MTHCRIPQNDYFRPVLSIDVELIEYCSIDIDRISIGIGVGLTWNVGPGWTVTPLRVSYRCDYRKQEKR
jgi:hypothetical protein